MKKTSDPERTSRVEAPHDADPRIFSRVYSHIVHYAGTGDTALLVDFIRAISLDRNESYYGILAHLEPGTRDLALELLRAKLSGAFPAQAWKDAHRLAAELNAGTSGGVPPGDETAAAVRSNRTADPPLAAQDVKRASNPISNLDRRPDAATMPMVDLGARAEEAAPSHRRPSRARSALTYAYQYWGVDSFKYFLGAAAAAAVIGLFILVLVLDQRIVDRRFEMIASWFADSVQSSTESQKPVTAGADTTQSPSPQETPNAKIENSPALPDPSVAVAESQPEGATPLEETAQSPLAAADDFAVSVQETPKEEPEAISAASSMPAPPADPVVQEATTREEDKFVIAPPLASAIESPAEASSAAVDEAPAVLSSKASAARALPPAITPDPPKPVERAAQKKAKPQSKAPAKPARPAIARKAAPKPTALEAENPDRPASPNVTETAPVAEPQAPRTAETVAPPVETTQPPVAAEQAAAAPAAATVEKPAPTPVANEARVEPDPRAEDRIVANPTFVERLLGFRPGERIARLLPGRHEQPQFIRQLEGAEDRAAREKSR